MVPSSKSGKSSEEVTYPASEPGSALGKRYPEIRGPCLTQALHADDALNRDIGELARLPRVLSGMHDQAAPL